jgi:hypothetical protein
MNLIFGKVRDQMERKEIVIASFQDGSSRRGSNYRRPKRYVNAIFFYKFTNEDVDEDYDNLFMGH